MKGQDARRGWRRAACSCYEPRGATQTHRSSDQGPYTRIGLRAFPQIIALISTFTRGDFACPGGDGMTSETPPYTCPRCGAVSHHPDDAANHYCGRCHVFLADMLRMRVWVNGLMMSEKWVINELESEAVAASHKRLTDAADQIDARWMIEVMDPAMPRDRAYMRMGTDPALMVFPQISDWPWSLAAPCRAAAAGADWPHGQESSSAPHRPCPAPAAPPGERAVREGLQRRRDPPRAPGHRADRRAAPRRAPPGEVTGGSPARRGTRPPRPPPSTARPPKSPTRRRAPRPRPTPR